MSLADFVVSFEKKTQWSKRVIFEIRYYEGNHLNVAYFQRPTHKKSLNFHFHSISSDSPSLVPFIFFHPWRDPNGLRCFFQCTLPEQQLILQNWSKHRPWQNFIKKIDLTTDSVTDSDRESEVDGNDTYSEEVEPEPSVQTVDGRLAILLTLNALIRKLNPGQAKLTANLCHALDQNEVLLQTVPFRLIVQGRAGTGNFIYFPFRCLTVILQENHF